MCDSHAKQSAGPLHMPNTVRKRTTVPITYLLYNCHTQWLEFSINPIRLELCR
jgi:hypothetical protein